MRRSTRPSQGSKPTRCPHARARRLRIFETTPTPPSYAAPTCCPRFGDMKDCLSVSGRWCVRWKASPPHVSRRNPDAESYRLDREVEGRREGDRFSVDSGRDGAASLDT